MKKLFLLIHAVAAIAFISSCGNGEDGTDTGQTDSTQVDSTAMIPEEPHEYYQVPAPDEMFSFIRDIGGEGKSTAYLNLPDNYKNYVETKSKALNFGIYATDFLYCSTFDYGAEALKYFVNVKKLGDELGISGAISEATAERIKQNIGKTDSLTEISNTVYFSSISDLEKSDKANVLALVIAGGWIESLYLVTSMTKKYSADNLAINRVAEQKYTLENLLGYLQRWETDANVTSVIGQLKELNGLFSELKEETMSGTVSAKNGKTILGGGTKISITEAQYKSISEKIKSIRDSFTM